MCELHEKSSWSSGLSLGPWSCKGATLPAAPPCHPFLCHDGHIKNDHKSQPCSVIGYYLYRTKLNNYFLFFTQVKFKSDSLHLNKIFFPSFINIRCARHWKDRLDLYQNKAGFSDLLKWNYTLKSFLFHYLNITIKHWQRTFIIPWRLSIIALWFSQEIPI